MASLRNLPTAAPERLVDLINIQPGRVVSMSMSSNNNCHIMLLAFDESESISEECYFGDTLYYVVEGALSLTAEGSTHVITTGECMRVPASVPHAIAAQGSCKLFQLTLND